MCTYAETTVITNIDYAVPDADNIMLTVCFSSAVADDNTAVLLVFRSHFEQLVNAVTHPVALAGVLYSRKLISVADKNRITTLTGTDDIDRATRLMNAVEVTMRADPRAAQVLMKLCEAIESDPVLEHVTDSIRAALG